jgi:hypothetical protein
MGGKSMAFLFMRATANANTFIPAKAGIYQKDWMPDQVRHDNH